MKTAKEWFETLEEPYRTQAIENTDEDLLKEKFFNLSKALIYSFLWGNTPQGHEYWSILKTKISNQIK